MARYDWVDDADEGMLERGGVQRVDDLIERAFKRGLDGATMRELVIAVGDVPDERPADRLAVGSYPYAREECVHVYCSTPDVCSAADCCYSPRSG